MKKKKKILFSCVLVIFAVMLSVCLSVIIPKINMGKTSSMEPTTVVNKNYEDADEKVEQNEVVKPEAGVDGEHIGTLVKNELDFLISDKHITKSKSILGETTTFELTFKLFVENHTSSAKTVLTSAFSAIYDISDYASYFQIESKNESDSVIILEGDVKDFDFTVKYIVTNTNDFKIDSKNDLTVSYMQKKVGVLSI